MMLAAWGVKQVGYHPKGTTIFPMIHFHEKLNGTESQRTPDQVSCDRAIRSSGLGVRSVGPVGYFLDVCIFVYFSFFGQPKE